MKRFLYLFQVEQDLPPSLEAVAGPDSDIVFLSWRTESSDPRSIYYPSSSWTQGRNRLLKEVCDREYLYFIFADDDLLLEFTQLGLQVNRGGANPWRAFEDFLSTHEPAIGCVSYDWHLTGGAYDPKQDCQTLRFFDALLNAFHREAVGTLLPYYDLFDEESECYSQNLLCSLAADLYAGHVLQTNRLRVTNTQTRRDYGTLVLSKPENFYLRSLRHEESRQSFLRQTVAGLARHPTMGTPLPKRGSYTISPTDLSDRYHLDHPFWNRKRELLALSTEDTFYAGDPSSPRALRWREHRPHRSAPPPFPAGPVPVGQQARAWVQSLMPTALAQRLVLRWPQLRYNPVARFARALLHPQAIPPATQDTLDRRTHRESLNRWQTWFRESGIVYEISESRWGEIIQLLIAALNELHTDRIVLVDVGAGCGDFLRHVQSNPGLTKPLCSFGIDPINTQAHLSYTGFVLGAITNDPEGEAEFYRYASMDCSSLKRSNPEVVTHDRAEGGPRKYYASVEIARLEEVLRVPTFRLSTIIRQYELSHEVLHLVKIDAQGSDLDVFLSLNEFTVNCLFLQIETVMSEGGGPPATLYAGQSTFHEDHQVIEAAGFRLFNIARFGVTPEADLLYVNLALFRKLLPQLTD